jgi:small-conductance mechanosensitive channel
LVKDVVTGLFFLLEDAFRLGEYIDVGVAKGTVEAISIRSMKLRHHRGPLNTVPFGAVGTLTNHSRDWVVVKLRFRVTYDTDPAKVKRIVKSIGAELAADPEYGLFFLQPLKSQGVIEMDEFGMIVSVKYTTRPGDQFTIRREVYQRIRAAFDEAGIQFASRANLLALAGQEPETKKAAE